MKRNHGSMEYLYKIKLSEKNNNKKINKEMNDLWCCWWRFLCSVFFYFLFLSSFFYVPVIPRVFFFLNK